MCTKHRETISAALKALGVVMILSSVPVIPPFLVWSTLAANLPLVTVILLLISMTVISNCLTHVTVRMCTRGKHGSHHKRDGASERQATERNQTNTQAFWMAMR